MARVIQPPKAWHEGPSPLVYLAGSIEMGDAPRWQDRMIRLLQKMDLTIANPRRDEWDSSWRQDETDPRFVEQVTWELYHLRMANLVVFHFVPGTRSPISLLELGLVLGMNPDGAVVVSPDGFWREGNVRLTTGTFGGQIVRSFEEAAAVIRSRLAPRPTIWEVSG